MSSKLLPERRPRTGWRRLAAPGALLLLTGLGPAAAQSPAEQAARGLFAGTTTPTEAAAAWRAAKLDPEEALALVRGLLPFTEPPAGDHTATLTDPAGRTSEAEVRLPADGPDGEGRYGALILLHGLGGNSTQGLDVVAAYAPPHTIVIAPTAQEPAPDDKAEDLRTADQAKIPVMGKLKHWWSYRERCFPRLALDYLRERYRLDGDRVLLLGYSMGGFGAWNIGLRYPDLFAGVVAMAGGISREEYFLGRDVPVRTLLENVATTPFFFVHGDEDEVVPVRFDRWNDEDLQRLKLPRVYREVAGGKHKLQEVLDPSSPLVEEVRLWLRDRRRATHPAEVAHRAIGAYHSASFWLRLDGMAGWTARARATTSRNRIAVETEGVTRLSLFLDPELVKVKDRVTVLVDGQPAFRGKVRSSLEAVAESFARSRDPELTWAHQLTLDVTPRGDPAPEGSGGGWGDLLKRWGSGSR